MNLTHLQAKIDEYLLTLDNISQDEYYTTERAFADGGLTSFMAWLQYNNE